jgi:cysteine-S-conjugate beta-lyase
MTLDPFGFDSLDLDWLRAKQGGKWSRDGATFNAWVADMDFPPAPVISQALQALVDGGDFGYRRWPYLQDSPLKQLFVDRMRARYGWLTTSDEALEFDDVIHAVQTVIERCTSPGDGVLLHTPSYPPFRKSIEDLGRKVIEIPAARTEHGWAWGHSNVDGASARVLLLCHPHNPLGRVFGHEELSKLAVIAEQHDLLVISDEVHAELVYDDLGHIPFAMIPGMSERTVTITSASKAFNLAGVRWAIAHLGPQWVRDRLASVPSHVYGATNVFGVAATVAAWTEGDEWQRAVSAVLDRNRRLVGELLAEHLPDVDYVLPEATYLAWLDCRRLGFADEPADVFLRRGVRLSPGPDFGAPGFVRLNFATSAAVLTKIVEAMGTDTDAEGSHM